MMPANRSGDTLEPHQIAALAAVLALLAANARDERPGHAGRPRIARWHPPSRHGPMSWAGAVPIGWASPSP
jgi:hypothetical protein